MKSKRFTNPDPSKTPQGLADILKWKFGRDSKRPTWPKFVRLKHADLPPAKVPGQKTRLCFVGQATFLIQTESVNILTDPIWSHRCGPFKNYGPERVIEPGIAFNHLPKIDIVLISHNHYDHMDIPTLQKLCERDNPKIIVPLKNETILQKKIPKVSIESLAWHHFYPYNEQISIHLEPSQHWSRRSLLDKNKALWGTFIIKTPTRSLCFIGDSGYDPKIFKAIGKKFTDIEVSIIPIGAYEPRWFMKDVHMNPFEAVLVHQDLKSKYSIASHFETFQLGYDEYKQPALELADAMKKYQIAEDVFITPEIGGAYYF